MDEQNVLTAILEKIDSLQRCFTIGPQGPPGPQGVQGAIGPACPYHLDHESRLTRIETSLENFICAVREDRDTLAKTLGDQSREVQGLRRYVWLGIGGAGTISFLSPLLFRILHL